jgi:hypothetical protein
MSFAENSNFLFTYAKFLKVAFLKMNIPLYYGCFCIRMEKKVSKTFMKRNSVLNLPWSALEHTISFASEEGSSHAF